MLDVLDGATVEVGYRGGTTIRVIGIDTPETVGPSTPDECFGAQASAAANRMLQGRRVALVFDPSQGRLDKYGRTLAYLRIPGTGDFGLAMIRRGFAAEYTYDPPTNSGPTTGRPRPAPAPRIVGCGAHAAARTFR